VKLTFTPVPVEPRKAMTPARKARIHAMRDGKCWLCSKAVPVSGPSVVYDHRMALFNGGTDDNSNLWPICADPCNKLKTAADLNKAAKIRRQQKLHDEREPTRIPARKFESRPFPTNLKRKMNGQVVRREDA